MSALLPTGLHADAETSRMIQNTSKAAGSVQRDSVGAHIFTSVCLPFDNQTFHCTKCCAGSMLILRTRFVYKLYRLETLKLYGC